MNLRKFTYGIFFVFLMFLCKTNVFAVNNSNLYENDGASFEGITCKYSFDEKYELHFRYNHNTLEAFLFSLEKKTATSDKFFVEFSNDEWQDMLEDIEKKCPDKIILDRDEGNAHESDNVLNPVTTYHVHITDQAAQLGRTRFKLNFKEMSSNLKETEEESNTSTYSAFDCFILRIVSLFKTLLNVTFILLPIALIVFITIDFAKCVIANKEDEMKKSQSIAIKRIIYSIGLFFIPTIVNITIGLVDDALQSNNVDAFTKYWTNATKENIQSCVAKEKAEIEKEKEANANKNTEEEKKNNGTSNTSSGNNNNTQSPTQTNNNYTIYVGDSRTVGMCSANNIGTNSECIAEVGKGYGWLKTTAIPKIYTGLNKHNNANVVINLGVNDLGTTDTNTINGHASNYAKIYNELASKYPKSKVIIVSVGVVSDSDFEKQKEAVNKGLLYTTISNQSVEVFNKAIKNNISGSNISYCDINTALKSKYKTAGDGLHYTNDTYKSIYSEIKKCL